MTATIRLPAIARSASSSSCCIETSPAGEPPFEAALAAASERLASLDPLEEGHSIHELQTMCCGTEPMRSDPLGSNSEHCAADEAEGADLAEAGSRAALHDGNSLQLNLPAPGALAAAAVHSHDPASGGTRPLGERAGKGVAVRAMSDSPKALSMEGSDVATHMLLGVKRLETHFDPVASLPEPRGPGRSRDGVALGRQHPGGAASRANDQGTPPMLAERSGPDSDRLPPPPITGEAQPPSDTGAAPCGAQVFKAILEAVSPQREAQARLLPPTATLPAQGLPLRIIEIQLAPASLGIVNVVLEGRSTSLRVRLEAELGDTAQALDANRMALAERMSDAGYHLEELTVAHSGPADGALAAGGSPGKDLTAKQPGLEGGGTPSSWQQPREQDARHGRPRRPVHGLQRPSQSGEPARVPSGPVGLPGRRALGPV